MTRGDFADCVRGDRTPEVDGRVAHEDLAVVISADASSRPGKTVEAGDYL